MLAHPIANSMCIRDGPQDPTFSAIRKTLHAPAANAFRFEATVHRMRKTFIHDPGPHTREPQVQLTAQHGFRRAMISKSSRQVDAKDGPKCLRFSKKHVLYAHRLFP